MAEQEAGKENELTPEELKLLNEAVPPDVKPSVDPANPDAGNDPKTEDATARERKGLIGALQDERTKRHAAEEKANQVTTELTFLQGQQVAREEKPPTEEDPLAHVRDEEVVTGSQLKTILKTAGDQYAKSSEAEKLKAQAKQEDDRWFATIGQAKEKYTEEKVGKGLDFETVHKRGTEFTKDNEALRRSVRESQNPAETLYRLGLTHPESIKAVQAKGASGLLDELTGRPKTLRSGGGDPPTSKSPMANMTLEELNRSNTSTDDVLKELERMEKEG